MIPVALVFPGQGAQKVGMGKELYDSSPEARAVFDEADSVIPGLSSVIFDGPEDKLTSTAFCQPAILTVSVAALQALQAHSKFKDINPQYAAGLSLGEYSALTASGALSFLDTLKLVQKRSAFMEEATKLEKGAMAAIIGFSKDRLKEICKETGAQVANYNSPEQIVITGHADKVEQACDIIKNEGAKSVIPLDVSGAFHSTLMEPAARKFEEELKNITIRPLQIPVVTNVNAFPQDGPEQVRENLAKQITSSVQWEGTIEFIASKGIAHFIEIGPGKVLRGLIRKTDSSLVTSNILSPQDIESLSF